MKAKILIVDDERTVIQQVYTLLESFGYESDFIPKADFLFKKIELFVPDLILMDINMPGIDGITALKRIKQAPEFAQIPVIMMTADTNETTLENCFTLGADDYITKPIKELVLKARVKSVIDKQIYIQEIKSQNVLLEAKNRNITRSINYARTIQEAMLPDNNEFKRLFPDSLLMFRPKDIVSGDFYWVAQQEQYTFIAAVDCTGHGVPGAFMSILADTYLNQIVHIEKVYHPHEILNKLHIYVRNSLKQSYTQSRDGMDISLCLIDKTNQQVLFAGAHNSLIHFRNGTYTELRANAFSVGGRQREAVRNFTQHSLEVQTNDLIYLYSDGYSDQFGGPDDRKFLKKRFTTFLSEIHHKPLNIQEELLNSKFDSWKKDNSQIDDILVMGFRL